MIDKEKISKPLIPVKLDNVTIVIIPDELREDTKIENEDYYEQPQSDSDSDICGPLNCHK
jgi:hypothetical protein